MKLWIKLLTGVFVVSIIGMQFIRPKQNSDAGPNGSGISAAFHVPENIQDIVQHSCYDCHSNTTRYPWYANVQPVGWWLNHHITQGKHELNFDEFASYRPGKQYHKLKSIEHQLQQGDMPLQSYLFIHRDAVLSEDQKAIVIAWCEAMRDSMKSYYPADSLELPKHQ